jgi:hypothetical protein
MERPNGLICGTPHVSVRQLRDWLARFPYLPNLRDPLVLGKAISEALTRADAKYAVADRFDEAKGESSFASVGRRQMWTQRTCEFLSVFVAAHIR